LDGTAASHFVHWVYQAFSKECLKFMGWMYSKTVIYSSQTWRHQWRGCLWKSLERTGTVKTFRWDLNRLYNRLIKNSSNIMPSTIMSSKWALFFMFYYQKNRVHFSPAPYLTHDPPISSFWILSIQLYSLRCTNHASYSLPLISITFSPLMWEVKFQIHVKEQAKWLALMSHGNVHIY
jgi:hypothetical protein